MVLRYLAFTILVCTSGAVAHATECSSLSIEDAFNGAIDPRTLYAEQVLVDQQPFGLNSRDYIKWLVPSARNAGGMPQYYKPWSRNIFELKTVLIPQDDLVVMQAFDGALREPWLVQIGGAKYVRFFIHPLTEEYYRPIIEKYTLKDEAGPWCGTPSSSPRSIYTTDANKAFTPFIVKLSLPFKIAGLTRIITPAATARAVKATQVLLETQETNAWQVPDTEKSFEIFPESVGVYFKGENKDLGAILYRTIPKFFEGEVAIPWFALMSGDEPRWIDVLFERWSQSHPRGTQLEFVWNELVKPLVGLHVVMSMERGMTTELHTQNAMVKIKDNRVQGVLIKDMDSHWFDYPMVMHRLGGVVPLELTPEQAHLYKYGKAQTDQPIAYINNLREKSIRLTFQFFLDKDDQKELLQMADHYVRSEFLKRFEGDIEQDIDIEQASFEELFASFHRTITPPQEVQFYEQMAQKPPRDRPFIQRVYKWLYHVYDAWRRSGVKV